MEDFQHIPVLMDQILELLSPKPGEHFLDCTLGGGGHARKILEKTSPSGKLFGIDRDPYALDRAKSELSSFENRLNVFHGEYGEMDQFIPQDVFDQVDGALIDCGVSSFQLDMQDRGFSFRYDAPLDMRMNPTSSMTAKTFLSQSTEEEIANVIYEYGEERNSRKIARNIVTFRKRGEMNTTFDLVSAVLASFPPRNHWKINPATRTFQAIRMKVNAELDEIKSGIGILMSKLKPSARIVVITFHSLEDRIVKNLFRDASKAKQIRLLNKKPLIANRQETIQNPRSRSAKARGIEILST